ncbi:hypothetical protein GCM10010441_01720 [Kitasatospora paracochleata]
MLWWPVDPIRIQVTGRSARFSQLVVELAWNPGAGEADSYAADMLTDGMATTMQLSAPVGSVVLVAPGAGGHPGVQPAVDAVRAMWPAAALRVVDETVAALVGACPEREPAACVVVHLDAVRTSVAVLAGREVVARGTVVGGARGLADAVAGHLRAEHRLDVGQEQCWAAAVHDGAFGPSPTVRNPGPVYGSVITADGARPGEPGKVSLSAAELRAVLAPAHRTVADLVGQLLRDTAPETAQAAANGGLLLTGPHPPGVDHHLSELTGLPARHAVEPKLGFDQPRVLRDGVTRLLAETPPAPDLAQFPARTLPDITWLTELMERRANPPGRP